MPGLLATPTSALGANFVNCVLKWMTDLIVVRHLHDNHPTQHECLEISMYLCDEGFGETTDFLYELYQSVERFWGDPLNFLEDGHHHFIWDPNFYPTESDHHIEIDTPDLLVTSFKEDGRPTVNIRFPFGTEAHVSRTMDKIHCLWESYTGSPLMNQPAL